MRSASDTRRRRRSANSPHGSPASSSTMGGPAGRRATASGARPHPCTAVSARNRAPQPFHARAGNARAQPRGPPGLATPAAAGGQPPRYRETGGQEFRPRGARGRGSRRTSPASGGRPSAPSDFRRGRSGCARSRQPVPRRSAPGTRRAVPRPPSSTAAPARQALPPAAVSGGVSRSRARARDKQGCASGSLGHALGSVSLSTRVERSGVLSNRYEEPGQGTALRQGGRQRGRRPGDPAPQRPGRPDQGDVAHGARVAPPVARGRHAV